MKHKWMATVIDGVSDEYLNDAGAGRRKSNGFGKTLGAIAACICIVLGTVFSAYAFSDDVRSFINLHFFKNNLKITEGSVPKGYTAIYDAEGLDAVRNDLEGNYILMSDIHFTEADFAEGGRFAGGWEPIGNGDAPFCGTFNGNGYVIHGLRVDTEAPYAGLFGYVYASRVNTGGVIKNLGIRDASISMVTDVGDYCYAGVIAGKAEIVAGCFVEDSEVYASYLSYERLGENYDKCAYIGGLCGDVYIADSCYVDAKVMYEEHNFTQKNFKDYPMPYVGGFAGNAFCVINSISLGSAECLGEPKGETVLDGFVANNYLIPRLINGKAFYNIVSPFMGESGDPWGREVTYKGRVIAYKYVDAIVFDPQDYVIYTVDPSVIEEMHAFYDIIVEWENLEPEERTAKLDMFKEARKRFDELPDEEKWYRITEDIVTREMQQMLSIIEEIYPRDEYINMLRECGMRAGIIDCYTELQKEYVGFDTEKIWRIEKDGTPKLRIFD
ncbi:MAG: hypothetical protein IIV03_01375 [Clostridia bacterium]|nr:hypothetical protein [Clostridia bacterium]